MAPSSYYYRAHPRDDAPVVEALNAFVGAHPRDGFWMCRTRLCDAGRPSLADLSGVLRLEAQSAAAHEEALALASARGAARAGRTRPRVVDRLYAHALYTGRVFRTLNIVDDFAREALAIEIDTSLPAARVIRTLENLTACRRLPWAIRCDNGPEFLAQGFVTGVMNAPSKSVTPNRASRTKTPSSNDSNRTFRRVVLDLYLFEDLDQVREQAHRFLIDYNSGVRMIRSTIYRRGVPAAV